MPVSSSKVIEPSSEESSVSLSLLSDTPATQVSSSDDSSMSTSLGTERALLSMSKALSTGEGDKCKNLNNWGKRLAIDLTLFRFPFPR